MRTFIIVGLLLELSAASMDATRRIKLLIDSATEVSLLRQRAVEQHRLEAIPILDVALSNFKSQISEERSVLVREYIDKQDEYDQSKLRHDLASDSYIEFIERSRMVDFYTFVLNQSFKGNTEESVAGEMPEEIVKYMIDSLKYLTLKYLRNVELSISDYDIELSELFDTFSGLMSSRYLDHELVDYVLSTGVAESISIRESEIIKEQQEAVHRCQDIAMDLAEMAHYLERSAF
jgi:hypothetical protein